MESGLIQMNAHMVVTGEALSWMIVGVIVAVVGLLVALLVATGKKRQHKWRYFAAFLIVGLLGIAMVVGGDRVPRRKVIKCCASGPVSLEQIAILYDIIEVDGKMITLVER